MHGGFGALFCKLDLRPMRLGSRVHVRCVLFAAVSMPPQLVFLAATRML
jgi:hypothetical protein